MPPETENNANQAENTNNNLPEVNSNTQGQSTPQSSVPAQEQPIFGTSAQPEQPQQPAQPQNAPTTQSTAPDQVPQSTSTPPTGPTPPATSTTAPGEPQAVYWSQPGLPASNTFSSSANPNKKKLLIAGIAAAVVLLGGGAGAYFGLVLPNQPDRVWSRALDRTAKGYDKLVDYTDKQEQARGGTLKGSFKFENDKTVVDGNIDSKYYGKNSTTKLDAGAAGARVNLEVLTTEVEGVKNPDIYFKVSGLKGIDKIVGTETGVGEAIGQYDNQWIVADHTLLDQAEKEAQQAANSGGSTPSDFTKKDAIDIANAVGKVNREYIFTTDPSKAVLDKKQNVGKEKLENRSVYHYKVGYNKDHLKDYMNALKSEMKNTKLKDTISDSDFDSTIKSIDQMDGKGDADVYVDMKTKLIRTVRFTDKDKKDSYMDVSLKYTGGDEYPFVVDVVSKEKDNPGTFSLGATLNTKKNSLAFNSNLDIKEDNKSNKFTLQATLAKSDEQVKVTKPANAKSITEIYGQLLGGSSGTGPATDDFSSF